MMKTIIPLKLMALALFISAVVNAQTGDSLVINGSSLISGSALQAGARYRFANVKTNVDAIVRIDSLVNGAQIVKIDDNSGGLGFRDAFQPEIRIPGGTGYSYAVFTISFVQRATTTPVTLTNVKGTALDIDGNLTVKEMVQINMGGGTATYSGGLLDINVLQILTNTFKAENILGIERPGIDTTAMGNMYTVSSASLSSFTYKAGANRLLSGTTNRQYSLFMKGFTYSNAVTLPVKLESFTAMLNNNKTDLKWITATEINVSHFVIEKSLDGKVFSEAGLVFAYGNTSAKTNYAFSDNVTGQTGVIYYRLRSVDIDGKDQYSDIRAIRIGKQSENAIGILTYPNPATNELRVTIPANWQNKKVTYELYKANGAVARQSVVANASQTETINVSSLATGFYIVRVSCNGEKAQQKIIKQ